MSINKEVIDSLFEIGDAVSCSGNENAILVTAILEDHIRLQAVATGEIRISYSELSAMLNAAPDSGDTPVASAAQCFADEYRRRDEQARRDDAVDAMWRSAIVCQL